jgi:hypothetical protein
VVRHVELRTDGVIGVQAFFQARHLRPHVEALRRVPGQRQRAVFFEGDQLAIGQPQLGLRQPHRLPGHLTHVDVHGGHGRGPLKASDRRRYSVTLSAATARRDFLAGGIAIVVAVGVRGWVLLLSSRLTFI